MSNNHFPMVDSSEIEKIEEVMMYLTNLFLTYTSLSPLIINTAALGLAQFLVLGKDLSEGQVSAIHLCLSEGGEDLKLNLLSLAPQKLKKLLR